MSQLKSELQNLEIELVRLIPQVLTKLVENGSISASDPVDAVAVQYSSVGNSSVFTTIGVRTALRRQELEAAFPDWVDDQLNPAEYGVHRELTKLIDVPPTYTDVCEHLTQLVIRVEEARPEGHEDFSEYRQLEESVRRVCLYLTQNWSDPSVPSTGSLFFYALNFYHDSPIDAVARSVRVTDLRRAGYESLPRECPECSLSFIATVDGPLDATLCPACGEQA